MKMSSASAQIGRESANHSVEEQYGGETVVEKECLVGIDDKIEFAVKTRQRTDVKALVRDHATHRLPLT